MARRSPCACRALTPQPQVPGLAVVIVGDRKDSATYVRMKKKACADVGIRSFDCDLPGDASQADVLAAVSRFNSDPDVHGILVQLPVRSRRETQRALPAVSVRCAPPPRPGSRSSALPCAKAHALRGASARLRWGPPRSVLRAALQPVR